jgi:hypothetical protein
MARERTRKTMTRFSISAIDPYRRLIFTGPDLLRPDERDDISAAATWPSRILGRRRIG